MENKKIDVLFGIVVIAFLVVTIVLLQDFKYKRANDFKGYAATLTSIVKQKNNKIIVLANRLRALQKENMDLKNTLAETRNDLDSLSKKLVQPAPAAAPVAAPAPATAPAPAAY